MCRVGHDNLYIPYLTVYLVISLPKIPYIHCIFIGLGDPAYVQAPRICMVIANPTYVQAPRRILSVICSSWRQTIYFHSLLMCKQQHMQNVASCFDLQGSFHLFPFCSTSKHIQTHSHTHAHTTHTHTHIHTHTHTHRHTHTHTHSTSRHGWMPWRLT